MQRPNLTCNDTDNIILNYLVYEPGDKSYFSFISGHSFFERVARCHVILFLRHVVRGELNEADDMLKYNPRLLLESGRVTDYTCTKDGKYFRRVEGTAFRLAMAAKDVKIHRDEECMVEMIKRHFQRLPNWEAEMKKQYYDQFPEPNQEQGIIGWKADANVQEVEDKNVLVKVFADIAEIKLENDNDYSDEAYKNCEEIFEPLIDKFRDYLDRQIKDRVITTGFHSNDKLLEEAFNLYVNNFTDFGNDSRSPKNKLCLRKLVGYVERFVTACIAQAFCSSLSNYVILGGKLERSLEFKKKEFSFFPLSASSGLGYEWAFVPYEGFPAGWRIARGFSILMTNKNNLIATYYATDKSDSADLVRSNVTL